MNITENFYCSVSIKKVYEAFLDDDIRTKNFIEYMITINRWTIFNWKLLYAILLYGVMAYLTQPRNVSEISQKWQLQTFLIPNSKCSFSLSFVFRDHLYAINDA